MPDPAQMSFLVVEDSTTMRRIIRACLAKYGYTRVTEAADGNQAKQIAQTQAFDCIVTDWNMPNCDGLTFVQHIRTLPLHAKTPVVMVTTESAKEDVVEALTHGVNSYIIKPFTPEMLKAKLDLVLK